MKPMRPIARLLLMTLLPALFLAGAAIWMPEQPVRRQRAFCATGPTTRMLTLKDFARRDSPDGYWAPAHLTYPEGGGLIGVLPVAPNFIFTTTAGRGSWPSLTLCSFTTGGRIEWALWDKAADPAPSGAPVHAGNLIVMPAALDGVFAFDDRTFASVWTTRTPLSMDRLIAAGPVIVGGAGQHAYGLDLRTGQLRWDLDVGGTITSALAQDPARPARAVAMCISTGAPVESDAVLLIDPATGAVQSRLALPAPAVAGPALAGDEIYVIVDQKAGCGEPLADGKPIDYSLLALDRSGRRRWSFTIDPRQHDDALRSWKPSPITIGPERVYFSAGPVVYAIRRGDGRQAWVWKTPPLGRMQQREAAQPVLHDGLLYASTIGA